MTKPWNMVVVGGIKIAAFAARSAAEKFRDWHASGLAVSAVNYQIVDCEPPAALPMDAAESMRGFCLA